MRALIKEVALKKIERWSELKVGMRIVFVTETRTFRYTIHDIDRTDKSIGVLYKLPRWKQEHYTVLFNMPLWIKKGMVRSR